MTRPQNPVSPLSALADIRSGLSLRGRMEVTSSGGVPVLTLSSTSEGQVDPAGLSRADLGGGVAEHGVREGDIVFRTRLEPNVAVYLNDLPEPAVAIAPLVAIKVTAADVDPAYVAWYMNQPPAQREIARGARGSNMRMIPRGVVSSLPIALPDLETQRRIVAAADLADHERVLRRWIADKRHQATQGALLARARGAAPARPLQT